MIRIVWLDTVAERERKERIKLSTSYLLQPLVYLHLPCYFYRFLHCFGITYLELKRMPTVINIKVGKIKVFDCHLTMQTTNPTQLQSPIHANTPTVYYHFIIHCIFFTTFCHITFLVYKQMHANSGKDTGTHYS